MYNSSFSMEGIKRLNKPEGWKVSRDSLTDITFREDESIYGTHSIGLNGNVQLKQSRELHIQGGSVVFSCYVKTETDTGDPVADKYEPSEAGLVLVLRYADNTVSSLGVGFPKNTKGDWARTALVATVTKELHSYEVMIIKRTTTDYIVDLPMLESGKRVRSWTPSSSDFPKYTNTPFKSVTGVQLLIQDVNNASIRKLELQELASEAEFSDINVPTRIIPFAPKRDGSQTVQFNLGRRVNFHQEIQPTMWSVEGGNIKEASLITPDVFGYTSIVDLFIDQYGESYLETPASSTVKAITVVRDLLYAITEETHAGVTGYYLKIVKPHKIHHEDLFFESISDLSIPIQLNVLGQDAATEDIARIGICQDIPACIFIDTDLDRRFYFKLKYDYYYANFGTRKLFCRESYTDENAQLQVI